MPHLPAERLQTEHHLVQVLALIQVHRLEELLVGHPKLLGLPDKQLNQLHLLEGQLGGLAQLAGRHTARHQRIGQSAQKKFLGIRTWCF